MKEFEIEAMAERIVRLVRADAAAGVFHDDSPIDELETFGDLHEFVDANDYLIEVMRDARIPLEQMFSVTSRIIRAVDRLLRVNPISLDLQSMAELAKQKDD